jgi:hypothetical protein
MVTKTKIKNLISGKSKRNREDLIEKIQYYAAKYNLGEDNAKFVIIALFYVLGLSEDDSHEAFEKIQER